MSKLADKILEALGHSKDRWQFKVTTHYEGRPTETEFISANSEEEIILKHAEYVENAGENEEVSDPYPVAD